MVEFVQNYYIDKFLNPENLEKCNYFDKKLFGLTGIDNPESGAANTDNHDSESNNEDENEIDHHCENCHRSRSSPNNFMKDYLKMTKEKINDDLKSKKKIPSLNNQLESDVVSTNINDYFVKPVYTWFPETWVNNGDVNNLICPYCEKGEITRDEISHRNVDCIDTNAFILYSKFRCKREQCRRSFDALANTEEALKAGIPLSVLQRCPIGGFVLK